MKCPYINPTAQQCLECPLDECVRSLTADVNEQKRLWRQKNPEKYKAIRMRYYHNNLEKERDRRRDYYHRNKEKIINAQREKRNINKVECSECENSLEILDIKGDKCRMCDILKRVINKSCKTSPLWCPRRERLVG